MMASFKRNEAFYKKEQKFYVSDRLKDWEVFLFREEMLTMLKTCLVRQGLEEDGDEGVKVNN